MNTSIRKFVSLALSVLIFVLSSTANAQISSVQNLITKIESYNNFSYQSISKRRDVSVDTTVAVNHALFLKVPNDNLFGYFYSVETDHKTETFHRTDLYNGKGINVLSLTDSTYFLEHEPIAYSRSLIGGLRFLKNRYDKKPFSIITLKDTVINGLLNSHIVAKVYDTVDNNQHLYSYRNYYIDKQSGLPSLIIIMGRSKYLGAVNEYYDETSYFAYNINTLTVTVSDFKIPIGFKARQTNVTSTASLAAGTKAPDWALYDVYGKKGSLSEFKGKVVVLDFYYIGCAGCMLSLDPLNSIYNRYKDKGLVIAGLNGRDSKKAVLDFEKRYKIKFPGYINASNVVGSYQITAFPTYYIIDKEGNINTVMVGYNDSFEQTITAKIDKLLAK